MPDIGLEPQRILVGKRRLFSTVGTGDLLRKKGSIPIARVPVFCHFDPFDRLFGFSPFDLAQGLRQGHEPVEGQMML